MDPGLLARRLTMPPPHQENVRVLALIFLVFWLTTSSNDGQSGYFGAPFLAQERLARQRHAFGVLNSSAWEDFNPISSSDPPNGTEATRYLNISGFRQADAFAWADIGKFRERCLEWSHNANPSLPAGESQEQDQMRSSWDAGIGSSVWTNATGIVKGPWVRRNASDKRTWADYNFTAMTPAVIWSGTHSEWNRNVTGSEGTLQLRIEDKQADLDYDDEDVSSSNSQMSSTGPVREVAATLNIDDAVSADGSGSNYEMRLHGVHWPHLGNMLLTTTSEKFAGIFGLPHLAPDQKLFTSSQRLLNRTLNEVLRKKEKTSFSDQNNPWASSAEDAWTPSPHCEYIVYAQVHPILQRGPHLAVADGDSLDGSLELVRNIEDELRNPTGAPIRHIPKLQMSVVIYSPDCAYFMESKGPPHFSELSGNSHLVGFKEEIWVWNVNFCVLTMAAITLGQIWLLKGQMRESYTPSTMGRISFWTLIITVLADGMMFALSAVLSLDSTHFYLRSLILTFALFMSMMIGGSFLGEIYRVQESEWRPREREHTTSNGTSGAAAVAQLPTGDALPRPVTARVAASGPAVPIIIPSDQDIDAEIAENVAAGAAAVPTAGATGTLQSAQAMSFSTIIGRLIAFGSFVCFLSLASMSWWKPVRNAFTNLTLLAYLSFWIPQIWRNVQRNSRRAFSWRFMVGQSVLRIIPVAYFYLYPDNMVFSETDWTAFLVLAGWLWVQLWILLFQDVLGPRFGMPKGWMPEAWDYHPVLREDNLESGGLPIGLAPSTSTPTSPSLDRTRSLSLSSGEANPPGREKSSVPLVSNSKGGGRGGSPTQVRTIDCAICCEVLEVPVVKAGEDAEPAGGGVAGLLERRKYMVTPCRHIFHSPCLEGWLRFRLQCPICREELPPL